MKPNLLQMATTQVNSSQVLGRMQTIQEPIGYVLDWHGGSDVVEMTSRNFGLRSVVAALQGIYRYLEIHFPFVHAFQVMKEGDTLKYWQTPLKSNRTLYKVTAGGWRDRVSGQYPNVTAALDTMHEWLVVSECLRVSVVPTYAPQVLGFAKSHPREVRERACKLNNNWLFGGIATSGS